MGCWGPWVGQLHAVHKTSISKSLSSEVTLKPWGQRYKLRGLLQACMIGNSGCKGLAGKSL